MSTISQQYTAVTGDTITAARWNTEFLNIINDYNGSIANANIASNAAIALSKLATTPATVTGSETLTNKTLTNPILTKPTVNASVQGVQTYTPSGGGTATLDCSLGNFHFITMPAGNITIALSNVSVSSSTSQPFLIRILQDSGGSRTVTWFTTIKWDNGVTPTLTTTGSKADLFVFVPISSGNYDGITVAQNL